MVPLPFRALGKSLALTDSRPGPRWIIQSGAPRRNGGHGRSWPDITAVGRYPNSGGANGNQTFAGRCRSWNRISYWSQGAKTLELKIPIFVSDMSFGALSEEAKTALAKGAELAGTGICSGEGVDYIILDGRGGGTGAAPLIFRNNISIPTIPALARARHYLNKRNRRDITLILTGGIRVPADFIKALCLGADGVAISNSAMQAVGCIAARLCNTNNCPAGIATQNPKLAPN